MSGAGRVFSMLSLCAKAGKLFTGETMAENLLRTDEARLVILAEDASENTRKKFINKCFYYKKPALVYGERDALSGSVGKHNRTIFVVTDPHFAEQLQRLIKQEPTAPNEREPLAPINVEVAECQKSEYMNLPNNWESAQKRS